MLTVLYSAAGGVLTAMLIAGGRGVSRISRAANRLEGIADRLERLERHDADQERRLRLVEHRRSS